jgi:hypothetical protein
LGEAGERRQQQTEWYGYQVKSHANGSSVRIEIFKIDIPVLKLLFRNDKLFYLNLHEGN